ncbi:MAG: helix-turn-helix transcriptional regulator [Acetobacter sp.]|nr:helix-turn-helix transcriptional regulator [Bacteroides sp.]MCM1340927.1 helix-turn-helix transcriptional regulator [Acetobacter sp.]MCM1432517.1 helix-turn-helix transcriptional regulator [Clostridiales bacterium]
MDYYKFGNTLCKLREEHNLTQKELAKILDVSDKAVSKWENGQAIPRMETLEKIADTLETSVEELIIISKDNSKRVYIVNNYAEVTHIEIDGELYSIKGDEGKWIELNPSLSEHIVTVSGEFSVNIDDITEKGKNFKDKLINFGIKKVTKYAQKLVENCILHAECTYCLTDIENESNIEIVFDGFSIGDKAWICEDVVIGYPKINVKGGNTCLISAVGKNSKEFLRHKKKLAMVSELGIDIPMMIMAFPFRMAYFKSICKPQKLKDYINKADYYNEKYDRKEEKRKKRKHPFFKSLFIVIFFIAAFFAVDFAGDVMNVETEKPALVSADYSSIELFRDEYARIEQMPFDAIPAKEFGIETWYDARLDGMSKLDQTLSENKVTIFEDTHGKKYLWLVCNYTDNIYNDDGEYKEFKDFDNPMVYEIIEA